MSLHLFSFSFPQILFGIISPPRKAGPKQELWFENDDFGYFGGETKASL